MKSFNHFNQEFDSLAGELYSHQQQRKHFEALEKKLAEQLRELCNNQSHTTISFAYVYETRKGNIDYSLIPELKGIELDDYRKHDIKIWKLSKQ